MNYIKNHEYKKIFLDAFNLVAFFIAFNCVIYGIGFMPWFTNIITTLMPPLKGLQLIRTIWFNAFSWYFALMIILCRLHWKTVFKFVLLVLAFVSVCRIPNYYNHIRVNAHKFLYDTFGIEKYKYANNLLSYGEFYSPNLFERIKHDINYQGEWSVVFGLQPSLLYYNQISALDGFLSYYPMSYKKKFDKLLEPLFNAYPDVKASFDSWAGRAYIFPNNPSHHPQWLDLEPEVDMLINPSVFREMGGKYVFSRVKIKNASELGLTERGVYDKQEGSPYIIYVYEAK